MVAIDQLKRIRRNYRLRVMLLQSGTDNAVVCKGPPSVSYGDNRYTYI